MERLIEEWCDLDHNVICAAVNQWRAFVGVVGVRTPPTNQVGVPDTPKK